LPAYYGGDLVRIYTSLEPQTANQVVNVLGADLASTPHEADIVLLFPGFRGRIEIPEKTIVITGTYTPENLAYAQEVKNQGVSTNNIFFTPEEQININELQYIVPQKQASQVIGIVSIKAEWARPLSRPH
jgi:hypothetical protein